MRALLFLILLVVCDCIPRIWRQPCRQEYDIGVSNTGCSRKESLVLVDLVLFETNDSGSRYVS